LVCYDSLVKMLGKKSKKYMKIKPRLERTQENNKFRYPRFQGNCPERYPIATNLMLGNFVPELACLTVVVESKAVGVAI